MTESADECPFCANLGWCPVCESAGVPDPEAKPEKSEEQDSHLLTCETCQGSLFRGMCPECEPQRYEKARIMVSALESRLAPIRERIFNYKVEGVDLAAAEWELTRLEIYANDIGQVEEMLHKVRERVANRVHMYESAGKSVEELKGRLLHFQEDHEIPAVVECLKEAETALQNHDYKGALAKAFAGKDMLRGTFGDEAIDQ